MTFITLCDTLALSHLSLSRYCDNTRPLCWRTAKQQERRNVENEKCDKLSHEQAPNEDDTTMWWSLFRLGSCCRRAAIEIEFPRGTLKLSFPTATFWAANNSVLLFTAAQEKQKRIDNHEGDIELLGTAMSCSWGWFVWKWKLLRTFSFRKNAELATQQNFKRLKI